MEMILLTESEANAIRGNYGRYSALDPIKVEEGYALPLAVLNDPEFATVHDTLVSFPIQEVTFLPDPELPE